MGSEWSRAIAIAAFVATYVGLGLGRVPGFRADVVAFTEPRRAWLVLAMASTLAGNLTILGSVANLIVVESARAARVEIGFMEYCRVGVPLTLLTLLVGWLWLAFVAV